MQLNADTSCQGHAHSLVTCSQEVTATLLSKSLTRTIYHEHLKQCENLTSLSKFIDQNPTSFNPLNAELNPICCLLALLGAHHFLHVSRMRVKSLTLTLLMSYIYIYGAPILDVSRSHTTTQHSR